METTDISLRPRQESELHEIRVQGHLDERWGDSMEGLTFTRELDGTTTLTGQLADQAALHGVLNRIRDLGVPVVSVRRLTPDASSADSMRAIVQDRYGSADVLELRQVDRPIVGDGEVLIRVRAAGVDAAVLHLMTGQPFVMRVATGLQTPKAHTPGADVAGRVEAVGKGVTRFRPGDEVFGSSRGAYAEFATAREDHLVLKPAGHTFEEAASVPTSAATALKALRDVGQLRAGQKVLVVGASGGVGTFAVQIAKAFGAEVTGVCSTAKMDLVESIGADHVIDYTRQSISDGAERYDLIIDVGGSRSLSSLRSALTETGTLVLTGGEGGGNWLGMSRQLRAAALSPFVRQTLRFFVSRVGLQDLLSLAELMEAGKLRAVIDRAYPLDQASEAIRHFASGRTRGKVVITVDDRAD